MARLTASGARVRPPPRPPGPWSRRSRWSRGRRRPLSASSPSRASAGGSPLSAAGTGSARRDHRGRWSRRDDDEGSGRAVLGRRAGLTPGSTGFGSRAPSTQPAVVSRPRHSDRSYVAPVAGAVAAPWLPPWFQVGPRAAFGPVRCGAERPGECDTGIIVGVASACFSFRFDQRLLHDAQHQPHSPPPSPQAEGRLGRRAGPLRL